MRGYSLTPYNPQLVRQVIRIYLDAVSLYSEEAEELLLGTMAKESLFGIYNKQVNGPALGPFQVEPATHHWLWNYLQRKYSLRKKIERTTGASGPDNGKLQFDLGYSLIMARIRYWVVPEPLPDSWDIQGQAQYWDKHYNCNEKYGTPEEYLETYYRYVRNGK